VYQFQSIDILQWEPDPMLMFIELVAAGALEVVIEDMSILRCRYEEKDEEPRSPSREACIP
jgi:hypothetical protein